MVTQWGRRPGDVGAWRGEACARPQALACHDRVVVPALGVGSGDAARRRGPSGGPVERELVKKQQQRKLKERRFTGEWRRMEVGDGPVGCRVEIAVGICSLGVRHEEV